MKPLTPAKVAETYALPLAQVEAAWDNLSTEKVFFIAVSGKLGAGKDTVAPLVMKALGVDATHEFFARPLKEEVNRVVALIKQSPDRATALHRVTEELEPINHEVVVDALYDDVKSGVVDSAYVRTPSTRKALQWWGTEVRRAQDEDYWVKKAMASAVGKLAEGHSVFVTDARFANEVDAILSMPSTVARITVTPETQAARITARDGAPPKADSLTHLSETALDDYTFPLEIATDDMPVEDVVIDIISFIRAGHRKPA